MKGTIQNFVKVNGINRQLTKAQWPKHGVINKDEDMSMSVNKYDFHLRNSIFSFRNVIVGCNFVVFKDKYLFLFVNKNTMNFRKDIGHQTKDF